MAPRQPISPIRTRIVLEGGGRLEDVAQIMDIRLDADRIEWTRVGSDSIEVSGAINAYFYCLRSKGRGVEGQGFRIPFTREIPVEGVHVEGLQVGLEDLDSSHDFNPISGDFQHRVSAFVVLKEASKGTTDTGEARLSQVRHGERARYANTSEPLNDDAPTSTRPPSAEEFESMRQAVEGRSANSAAETRVPLPSQEEEPKAPPARETQRSRPETLDVNESSQSHGEKDAHDTPERHSGKERGETLVWKPFPPPIA